MRRALFSLGMILACGGAGLAQSANRPQATNPYLAVDSTRTYYMDDLERCPGILDLQSGDLWMLSFPEPVSDYFLTRQGIVEAKVSGQRVMLAGVGTSGSVPLMVLTDSGLAAQFNVQVRAGTGGQNKTVQILPGSAPKSSCPKTSGPDTAAPVAVAPAAPASVRRTPSVPVTPTASPAAAATTGPAIPVVPGAAYGSRFKTPTLPQGTIGTALPSGKSVQATLTLVNATTVRFEFRNGLGSPVIFNLADLNYAGQPAADTSGTFTLKPGQTAIKTVAFKNSVQNRLLGVTWAGRVTATGEFLTLRGRTPQ
ncbi:hypothetical protein [Deinococcus sp. Leaf326]|uniref:hypothetical protein n=1 Tax=Deinococcus sp. Leaf326 TaxID=1736338 RepID=UPI0006F83C45|nr:hypothetical protein [Deinococcus sp. Leaf326]KQR25612.1 hypothetical protein ASF71_18940 [Deinococcus sp. Leaf326]